MATNATAFSDLQSKVLSVFIRTDKTQGIKDAINETYKEMVACVDPNKIKDQIYKPTIAGREEYPIPDTILRINHPIRLIDPDAGSNSGSSYPLDFITKEEYDYWEPNPNASSPSTGIPWAYTFWKNSVLLTDIPNKVFRLEMNVGGEAGVLSDASDTPIFSPAWDEVIKAGALTRLYGLIKDWDSAERWQSIYVNGFVGEQGPFVGGLKLLKQLNDQISKAPLIVRPNDF